MIVDIFNIAQKVRDIGVLLKVDEEQINGGSHEEVRGKREELGPLLTTCQGYDTQILLKSRLN